MPDDQDKPGVVGPIHPPPSPSPPPPPGLVWSAGIAVAFEAGTVLALLLDRCDWATILAIIALIFGGVAFFMLIRTRSDDQDKPGVTGPIHPPP